MGSNVYRYTYANVKKFISKRKLLQDLYDFLTLLRGTCLVSRRPLAKSSRQKENKESRNMGLVLLKFTSKNLEDTHLDLNT